MKLIIAEKPNVMRDIVNALDPGARLVKAEKKSEISYYRSNRYIIICTLGHILNFMMPQEIHEEYKKWTPEVFPYDLPDPLPLKVDSSKKQYYNTLKKVLKEEDFDEIIVATDGDREGQGIYERIRSYMPGYPENIYQSRMWLTESTAEGIRKAFNGRFPNNDKRSLKDAAYLRAMNDYYIGMNGSGICTAFYGGYKNPIAIGRVQTAVGKIIEERENTILNFKPEDYVAIYLEIESEEDENLRLKHKIPSDRRVNRSEADKIIAQIRSTDIVRVKCETRNTKSKPYKLCDAMDLQKEMNKDYGYSANKTASLLQSLYQNKHLITYPGTKAHEISVSSAKMDLKPLENLRGAGLFDELVEKVFENGWHIAKHCVTDKGLAHEAITPVFGRISTSAIQSLTAEEMNVYKAVVRRYLQAFYPDAMFQVTKVSAQAAGEAFETSGKIMLEAGYLQVTGIKEDSLLPKVTDNKIYKIADVIDENRQTKPPARYTDATILDAMKNAGRFIDDQKYADILADKDVEGLGTSRTRGAILENMKKHGYYSMKGKTIYPTQKLMDLMKLLPTDITITSPLATAKMEEALMDVEEGRMDPNVLKEKIIADTRHMVESIKNNHKTQEPVIIGAKDLGKCPNCGKPLVERKGQYGRFVACSGYPDCNYIQKKEKITDRTCPKCGAKLAERVSRNKKIRFLGCIRYPECDYAEFPDNASSAPEKTDMTCPKCGSPMVKRNGTYGPFIACSNYPECRYIMPKAVKNGGSSSKTTNKVCPECGKPLVERQGKYGKFLACSGYPQCTYIKSRKKRK